MLGVEGVDHPSCIPSPEQLLLVGVGLISDFKNSGDIDMADTQRTDQIGVATVLVEIKRESLQGPLRGFLREFRAKTVVVRLLLGEQVFNLLGIRVVIRQGRVYLADRQM